MGGFSRGYGYKTTPSAATPARLSSGIRPGVQYGYARAGPRPTQGEYAGWKEGLGILVKIDHGRAMPTIRPLFRATWRGTGDKVHRATDRRSRLHGSLHRSPTFTYEVVEGRKAQNPLQYIQSRTPGRRTDHRTSRALSRSRVAEKQLGLSRPALDTSMQRPPVVSSGFVLLLVARPAHASGHAPAGSKLRVALRPTPRSHRDVVVHAGPDTLPQVPRIPRAVRPSRLEQNCALAPCRSAFRPYDFGKLVVSVGKYTAAPRVLDLPR